MVKKGKIEEIFSKALYADNPLDYTVIYRDFEKFKQVNLKYFRFIIRTLPINSSYKNNKNIKREMIIIYQKHTQ